MFEVMSKKICDVKFVILPLKLIVLNVFYACHDVTTCFGI